MLVKIGSKQDDGLASLDNLNKRAYKLNRYIRRSRLIEEFSKVLTFKNTQAVTLCLIFNLIHSIVE